MHKKVCDCTLMLIVRPSLDRFVADIVQSSRGMKLPALVDASQSEKHNDVTDSDKDDEPPRELDALKVRTFITSP